MIKKFFLTLTLPFALILCAFASTQNTITVTPKNPTFTITLQSNPTTRFSWQLISYDKKILNYIGHQFIPPKNKKLVGAPGYETWTFTAKKINGTKDQTTQITLQYRRPWTTDSATETHFTVKILRS